MSAVVGLGESVGFVGVDREAAENVLGFAARVGQLAVSLALTMTAFVERELNNRTAAVLDRVYFDFVLSIGEDDGLAHDFGWVVNRVSCGPREVAHVVGQNIKADICGR